MKGAEVGIARWPPRSSSPSAPRSNGSSGQRRPRRSLGSLPRPCTSATPVASEPSSRSSSRSCASGPGGRTATSSCDRPAHRRPRRHGPVPGRLHLAARADLLARVRARRPPLHALLRLHHAVLGGHARDGPRREHGPAHPRLGDHGPLLVPPHRPLVGGRGQRPGRAEGLLHRPCRRRRPARRHGDPVLRVELVDPGAPRRLRVQHPRHLGVGALGRPEPHRDPVGRDRPVLRLHRQERPVPAPHLVARRDGRPDAGVVAAPLLDDGRRRRLPGRPPLPGVLGGLPDRRVEHQPHRRDRRDHDRDLRPARLSCRTTSRRCSRTRRWASSAT